MPDPAAKPKAKVSGAYLETPFTIRQVETHLVFGPLSRHFPAFYLFLLLLLALGVANGVSSSHQPAGLRVMSMVWILLVLPAFLNLRKWTLRQQAIVGWIATKAGLGIGALAIATIGAGFSFARGQADAWPNLYLGLIWIPGLEFLPNVIPHQRWLTMGRMILSIPWIWLGIKSGDWHW